MQKRSVFLLTNYPDTREMLQFLMRKRYKKLHYGVTLQQITEEDL